MSVTLAIILFLLICFIFGSKNFFLAMTILAGLFVVLEMIWKKVFGTTISGMFWDWSETTNRRNVIIVAGSITVLAIFLTGHLALGW